MPASPHNGARKAQTSRLMRPAVVAAGLLALAGVVAFYAATQMTDARGPADAFRVTVTGKACEPDTLTVPAGRRTFEIVNASDRPVEWEILEGVMVVAERENITPGLRQALSARLDPGDYEMTCGLLSNPRGTLHVTPSEEARAAAAKGPGLREFIGPLSEYKVYLVMQASELVKTSEDLARTIEAGDIDAARTLYVRARAPYLRLEPVAYRFGDLKNRIDPVADYLAEREQDPAFTGFHRIEYGLFSANSTTAGLDAVARQLVADADALKTRVSTLKLQPADLAELGARNARQIADTRIVRGENHYAHTDLADLAAGLAGLEKLGSLLVPVAEATAPETAATLKTRLSEARAALEALEGADGYPRYDTVPEEKRKALSAAFGRLADAFAAINPAIGMG